MIFFSTGGYAGEPAFRTVETLVEAGIAAIELSGGIFHPQLLPELKKFLPSVPFKVHNYFPPPEAPFVFNLASLDPDINRLSLNHAREAIRWAEILQSGVYSFHAGFLLDPKVKELGKKIAKRTLQERGKALDHFLNNVNLLAKEASERGVELLIENNVLSRRNIETFGENPFLMADPEEARYIMANTSSRVNMLLDVAHLKVSSHSLGYAMEEMVEKCHPWIKAYHLSDNDGLSDSNGPLREDSWFWDFLKRDLDYYSLEIYHLTLEEVQSQWELARRKLTDQQPFTMKKGNDNARL